MSNDPNQPDAAELLTPRLRFVATGATAAYVEILEALGWRRDAKRRKWTNDTERAIGSMRIQIISYLRGVKVEYEGPVEE